MPLSFRQIERQDVSILIVVRNLDNELCTASENPFRHLSGNTLDPTLLLMFINGSRTYLIGYIVR